MLKILIWYIKSDFKLRYEECWYNGVKKIDGFKFYSKRPFSRSYQRGSAIGLEYTYPVLSLIQSTIKDKKRACLIEINHGYGYERIPIWKGSLKKAEEQIYKMIKEIQKQY